MSYIRYKLQLNVLFSLTIIYEKKMVKQFDENLLSDMLPIYYSKLFPQNLFCRWLSCGNYPQPLSNRELSFTLADDVYLRYLSINNQKELHTLFQKKCPYKLDIGPVYNTKPSIGRHDAVVLARELVFDIDMTDYDEVRTCCQEANVCDKCWRFMVLACEIINITLKDDFGFQNILWVFSGRRGIHCWVSDYEARTLDSPGRAAVADYMCLITGGDNQHKKVHLGNDNLHSSIKRSVSIIDKYFSDIMQEQEFLSTPERLNTFVKIIPDETLRNQVQETLTSMPANSLERWQTFLNLYSQHCKQNGTAIRKMKYLVEEMKIQFCYPRLDVNVTKGFNHLLKSPFSIHPKTGKVSIVFKPENAKNMKLDDIPTINTLLDDSSKENAQHVANMKTATKNFQEVVFSLEKSEALRRKTESNISIDF